MPKKELAIGEQRDGVLRRSANVYQVVLKINGKKHKRSFGSDYEAAFHYAESVQQQNKLRKLKGDNPVLDQVVRTKSKLTLGQLLNKYLSTRNEIRIGTLEFYKYLIRRMEPLAYVPAEILRQSEVKDFLDSLVKAAPEASSSKQSKNAKQELVSRKLKREIVSFCKSAYKEALDRDWISVQSNVFSKIPIEKATKRIKTKPFEEHEIEAIFEQLQERHRLMFWVQLSTGLRSGELIALRFKDILHRKNEINVDKTRRHGEEGPPKTDRSIRKVYMPPAVSSELRELQDKHKAKGDDYVFVTQYGLPYDDIPHEPWKQALERAKVPYRRCYTLRHTFASQAFSNKVRLGYVSQALGHTNVNTTAGAYIDYLHDEQRLEDQEKLARLSKKSLHLGHPVGHPPAKGKPKKPSR